jgi:hypothetical protein
MVLPDTSIQVISWIVFVVEVIGILAFSGLRFFALFRDSESGRDNKGWYLELALALVIPAWLSHFATAEGVGLASGTYVFLPHFKLWLIVAPVCFFFWILIIHM